MMSSCPPSTGSARRARGSSIAMSAIDQGRYTVAAGAVGLAQACLDASLKYAQERQTFGQEIGRHQLVQQMLAKMAAGTEMGRLLVWRAGWLKNQGLRNTRETSLAKWHATDHAVQAALDAIQIHGANGYSNEFPVERYLRNSKAAVIYEGTSQLHTIIQGEYALGYREDKPLRCEPLPAQGWSARRRRPRLTRAPRRSGGSRSWRLGRLVGATAFGLWHLIVGGLINGNPAPPRSGSRSPPWPFGLSSLRSTATAFRRRRRIVGGRRPAEPVRSRLVGGRPGHARRARRDLRPRRLGPARQPRRRGAVRAADPAQVRQLRLVLRLLESRLVNLLLTGRPRRRSATGRRPTRERVLLGWAALPAAAPALGVPGVPQAPVVPRLRRSRAAGRAEPAPCRDRLRHRSDPPVTAEPDRRSGRSTFSRRRTARPSRSTLEADVVVVGSGAGGGVIAAELARAGRSVVVVEAGPFVDEAHVPPDELDAYGAVYLNHGLLTTWDGSITMLAGTAVGGGTLVNWMTCIAAPADVRAEWARDHGLDGHRRRRVRRRRRGDRARARRGAIDGHPAEGRGHPARRGRARLGGRRRPGATPTTAATAAAVRSAARAGPSSRGCGSTSRRPSRPGRRIVDRARVTRVLVEGGRAVGVEARILVVDPATGEPLARSGRDPLEPATRPLVVRAPQVVVAAGALRTPAILLGVGPRPPGDRAAPAAPPGAGHRGDLRRARSTCGAARCRLRARSSSRRPTPGGTATPSSRRPATRA